MLLGSYVLPSPAQPRKRSPCRHSRFGVSLASRHHPLLEGSPALRRSALHQATRRGPINLRRRFYCLTDRLTWLGAAKDLKMRNLRSFAVDAAQDDDALLALRRHSQILLRADEDLIAGLVVDHRGVSVDRRAGVEAQRQVRRRGEIEAGEVGADAVLLLRQ